MSSNKWLPLESNPDVMNKFVHKLGMSTTWGFHDVFGLDPDLLMMVPQPVAAVLMVFPITERYENHRKAEEERIARDGQVLHKDVFFTKQTIPNACGTMGLIHAIVNNQEKLSLADGFFTQYIQATKEMTPDQRAAYLEETNAAAATITEAHAESAQEGQSAVPAPETKINLHFAAFVHRDGCLYELDGRRAFPINRGPCTEDAVLLTAANSVKAYIDLDPTQVNFNLVALAPVYDD